MVPFRNRSEAAQFLIPRLQKYMNENGIVMAIPMGGVPVAYPVAMALKFPLELALTQKIGYPGYDDYPIGAVSTDDQILDLPFEIDKNYLYREVKTIREKLLQSYRRFMGEIRPSKLYRKTIILIDDGATSGYTLRAAIEMLRKKKPKRIIVAIPVAPLETAEDLRHYVDELICLYAPPNFRGEQGYYIDFSKISDSEVKRLVDHARQAALL